MADSFRAIFYRRIGDTDRPKKYKEQLVEFHKLKELTRKDGTKLANSFEFEKGTYVYDSRFSKSDDAGSRPIISYFVGNSLAIPELNEELRIPLVKFTDEGGNKYVEVPSDIVNKTFERGEMKSAIAGSQAEPKKFDWLTILIGGVMFTPVGFLLGILLHHQLGIP